MPKFYCPSLPGLTTALLLGIIAQVRGQAPTITAVAPVRNAGSAIANTATVFTFSQPMSSSPGSVGALHTFSAQSGGRKAGTGVAATNHLSFTPSTPYRAGERVSATVTTAAQSTGNQNLAQGQVAQFTVATSGSGQGFFSDGLFVATAATETALFDLEGDGDLDVAAVLPTGVINLYRNLGTGVTPFFAALPQGSGNTLLEPQPADLDNDGDIDLVAGDQTAGVMRVWLNNGLGAFTAAAPVNVGPNQLRIVRTGDFDADGDLDLVTAQASQPGQPQMRVFANNGSGSFTLLSSINMNNDNHSLLDLEVGDMDNDGDLDLVFLSDIYNRYVIRCQNNGSGTFAYLPPYTSPYQVSSLQLADLDQDNDLDAALGGQGGFILAFNNGTGTLSGATNVPFFANTGTTDWEIADVNADGRLDLIAANINGWFFTGTSVMLGSPGGWTHTNQTANYSTLGYLGAKISVGDLDGDGDIDLWGSSTTGMATLYNEPTMRLMPVSPRRHAASAPVYQTVEGRANQWLDDFQTTMWVFSAQAGGRKAGGVMTDVSARFDPVTDFRAGEPVTAILTAATQSVIGNHTPPRGHVWQFTTAASMALGFFNAATDAATGNAPYGIATADFNSDGTLDLATANGAGQSVTIRMGTGGGAYGAATTLSQPGVTPRALAAGDVDNDGDIDLALTTGTASPNVRLLINNGAGSFAVGVTYANTGNLQEVALADLNADGSLDLLTLDFNGNLTRRLNNGLGTFGAAQNLFIFTPATSMAVGDVDNDGDLDVAVGGYGATAVGLALNNGLGAFSNGATVTTNGEPRNVALVDLDKDDNLDLLIAGDGVERAAGLGNGAFASFISLVGAGTPMNEVAVGDLDGDADLDVLAAPATPAQVNIYLNDGLGVLSAHPTPSTAVSAGVQNLAVADLDNDGDVDFLAAATTANTVNVRINQNGPPPLPLPPVVVSTTPTANLGAAAPNTNVTITFDQLMNGSPGSVASLRVFGAETGKRTGAASAVGPAIVFNPAADFRPGECVSATITTAAQAQNNFPFNPLLQGYVVQFRAGAGAGPGEFNPGASYNLGASANAVAAADIDADGDADALVANLNANTVRVLLNNGAGVYTTGTALTVGAQPAAIAAGDLDADGDVDFVTADFSGNSLSVGLNNGGGSFAVTPGAVAVGATANDVKLADVDGDGDLDAVVATGAPSTVVLVRLNNGNGTFSPGSTVGVGTSPQRVALADLDNDGDLDLVASDFGPNQYIRLNNGSGTFTGSGTVNVGGGGGSPIALADIDFDGDADLIVGSATGNTISICPNAGNATFTVNATLPLSNLCHDVQVGDIDGDGDLDLVATSFVTQPNLSIWKNNGGTFSAGLSYSAAGSPRGLALTDIDGDDDLDLLLANFSTGQLDVRFNEYPDLIVSTTQTVPPGPWHHITVTSTGNATLGSNTVATGNVVVQTGGVWNDDCFVLSGPGTFTLQTGALLNVCHAQGISLTGATGAVQVAGTRTYNSGADYEYRNASQAQVTGTGFSGARNLTVNAPAGLTLSGGASVARLLTLSPTSGDFTLNGQNLTLLSSPSQTAMVVNAGAGAVLGSSATVQRYLTPGLAPALGYRHLSAPVTGSTMNDLAVATPPGYVPYVNPAYNPLPTPNLPLNQFPNIFGFDETRGGPTDANFADGWYSPTTLADPLTPGRGFSVYMRPLTPDFNGTLGNGNLTMSGLTRTGAFLGSSQKSGWHLLGNPYPAPIDWDNATPGAGPGQIPTGMSGSVSVYQSTGGNNGQYLTRVGGVGSLTNGEIAMAQAFFARVTGAGPVNFTFTNALRVTSYTNPPHYRPADTRPMMSLTLRAQNAQPGEQSEAFVYFDPNATDGLDAFYDGPVPGHNIGVPTLVSLLPSGDELAINALSPSALAGPTTVDLLADLPTTGTYELATGQWENLTGADVQLLDRLTNTRYDLSRHPTISFTGQSGLLTGRFALEFGVRPLGTPSTVIPTTVLTVWPNPSRGSLHVALPAGSTQLEVFDIAGRRIRTFANASPTLELHDLPAGMYLLRAGAAVQQLVVE